MVPSQFDFFKFNLVKKINHAWYPLQHASSFVQLLNVQSFLGMMGGLLATPLVVASSLCISGDNVATRGDQYLVLRFRHCHIDAVDIRHQVILQIYVDVYI